MAKWGCLACIPLFVVAMGAPLLGLPRSMWIYVLVAGVMCYGVWQVELYRWESHLERHAHRVCLRCGYPLPEGADEGRCAECGDAYSIKATAEVWRERLVGDHPRDEG
jgi:hypothetical protein